MAQGREPGQLGLRRAPYLQALRHLQGVHDFGIVAEFNVKRLCLWPGDVELLAGETFGHLDAVSEGGVGRDRVNEEQVVAMQGAGRRGCIIGRLDRR